MKQVFIWGMGLLGTSIAYDLKNSGYRVSGCVRSQNNLEFLQSVGLADIVIAEPSPQLLQLLEEADLILLAVPVSATREVFSVLKTSNLKVDVIITDMGSTKAEVMRLAADEFAELRFAGSHPMAGSELSGPQHARAGLFEGVTVYVTPGHYADVNRAVLSFWHELGCRVIELDALKHDRQLAYLSHGLHLLSCAAVHMIKDIPEVIDCDYSPAAGSFRDISRVSASNPSLWKSIIDSNKTQIAAYLERLEQLIAQWKRQLREDTLDIEKIFLEAGELRRRILKK